jgi:hypothetical protein
MSLAIYAAPFNDNNSNKINDDDDFINNKRQTQAHNKTQKRYPKENFDTQKVNSVLEKLHNNPQLEDDEKNHLGDFNPPPQSQSAGVNKTIATEQMSNMSKQNSDAMFRTLGRAPQPMYEGSDNLDLNDYNNYGDNKTNEDYYKKVLPGYIPNKNPVNKQYYNASNNNNIASANEYTNTSQDVLLQKLNYMISLLEEQQDEKTNNVTEEVVLYSFLGIFIIFIVDSFARVGKYVR